MAVNVMSIELQGENPTYFLNPFQIEIAFEAIQELPSDLEWRFVYVGSAENDKYDQVLDSITVGPISMGINKFLVETDAPDVSKIPPEDIIGVTCLLVTGHYCNQEFIRVGYFVNNEYDTEELRLNPPSNPDVNHIIREVLVNKPRVTKYPIDWTKISPEQPSMYLPPIFTGSNSNSAMDIEEGAHFETNGHSVGDKRGFEEDVVTFALNEAPQFDFSALGPLRNFTDFLKPELSKRVFQFLDVYELGKSRRVCRQWKNIIDSSVNWRSIVLDEWDETDNETMLRFLIQQSSSELEELIILDCPVINDDILNQWLRKCGKELKTLDLDWCINITTNGIASILENCNNIQALHLSHINNDRPLANSEEVISHITSKYKNRLFDFGMTYLTSQAVNMLVNSCGYNLTELYINHSTIDDNTLTYLVKSCSKLEVLSIAFCNSITPSLVSQIRHSFTGIKTLQATHSPQDFVIDIQAPENEDAATLSIVLKLKTGQEISVAQFRELSQCLKFFPRRIMENVVENTLICAGPLAEAGKDFEQQGFESEVVEEESEEEEEEDDNDMEDIEIDVEEPQTGRKRQKTA